MSLYTWVVVSNIFYFHPYLGKITNLTSIFHRGWNHQLDTFEINNHIFPGYKQHNILLKSIGKWLKRRTIKKGVPPKTPDAHHVWGIYSLQTAVSAVCPCVAQVFTWSQKLGRLVILPGPYFPAKRPRQFLEMAIPKVNRSKQPKSYRIQFCFPRANSICYKEFHVHFFRSHHVDIYLSIHLSIFPSLALDLSIYLGLSPLPVIVEMKVYRDPLLKM